MKKIRNSIRAKTALLTVTALIIAVAIATMLGVTAIRSIGSSSADRTLLLLCETGEQNLDAMFRSVEQSVEMVATLIEEDLNSLTPKRLSAHMKRVQPIVERMANVTNGVLTYYYRIDPEASTEIPGFWYTNLDGEGFVPHEVTDITAFDTSDTSALVWFTVPKNTGSSVWLPPYITDGLDTRVISYNHPIYYRGEQFVGVIGMEIDYELIASQVEYIQLEDTGYAFIIDAAGRLVYHPRIDAISLGDDYEPVVPEGLLDDEPYVTYTYKGVEMRAVWRSLSNGMRMVVTVPTSEISASWRHVVREVLLASLLLIVLVILVVFRFTGNITKPLRELTEAARQVNEGNYDFALKATGSDEVAILTDSFNQLVQHLKIYISDLNSLAYADALTHVRNKGAYDIYVRKLQDRLRDPDEETAFAVGIFDCDDLKGINDRFGHEKGDVYLKNASHLICHIFLHSPVFRTGGDEFSVILQYEDLERLDELIRSFDAESAHINAQAKERWEEVHVSAGFAVYDPGHDDSVQDVARRADKLMYGNKRKRKALAKRL